MWKDFFYFTKGQRIGIIILMTLIAIALIVNFLLPFLIQKPELTNPDFIIEVHQFERSLHSRDSIRQALWQKQYQERQLAYEEKYKSLYKNYPLTKKPEPVVLFTFDPNTLDSSGFVKLGLKSFIASNILKYRNKGGRFKTLDDFAKVYGISAQQVKELSPFIKIETQPVEIKNKVSGKRTDIIVDLNSADTTLLMQVKGIGRGYAKGIVRFRNAAGGFVSVDQLADIYGMRPENLEKIRPYCTVNPSYIRQIKVNLASVEKLAAHPYINFYQAKAIYELRRRKGKLKSIDDLKTLSEFASNDLLRIKPYLSFE